VIVGSRVWQTGNLVRIGLQSYKERAAVRETEVNLRPAQNPAYIVGPVRRNENGSNRYHRQNDDANPRQASHGPLGL
jgi:hypothetical protein